MGECESRENQHGTFGRLAKAICTCIRSNTNNQIDDDYSNFCTIFPQPIFPESSMTLTTPRWKNSTTFAFIFYLNTILFVSRKAHMISNINKCKLTAHSTWSYRLSNFLCYFIVWHFSEFRKKLRWFPKKRTQKVVIIVKKKDWHLPQHIVRVSVKSRKNTKWLNVIICLYFCSGCQVLKQEQDMSNVDNCCSYKTNFSFTKQSTIFKQREIFYVFFSLCSRFLCFSFQNTEYINVSFT